jgi:hypothetical protein
MKKITSGLIGVLALMLVAGGAAEATRGPQGVTYSAHNLSTSADPDWPTYVSDNETQVCVFCHTPHGGTLDGPLWNRENPTTSYTHYNSASLSTYLQGLAINRAVSKESLLCLSCHDGSIAINSLVNYSNSLVNENNEPVLPTHNGGRSVEIQIMFSPDPDLPPNPGPQIGASRENPDAHGDLSDDHPISFSYSSVYSAKAEEFKTVSAAEINGVRFFGTDNRVECSSCHDPHVMYDQNYTLSDGHTVVGADPDYTPFLITPNEGSALCLACHDK